MKSPQVIVVLYISGLYNYGFFQISYTVAKLEYTQHADNKNILQNSHELIANT